MITIIDYGLGNIQVFVNIYKRLNIPVQVAQAAGLVKTVQFSNPKYVGDPINAVRDC